MLADGVGGLDARLAERPVPDLNPPGFIFWHVLRVWDHETRVARGLEAVEDGWHRHGLSAVAGYEPVVKRGGDGVDYADGFDYDAADVAAIPYEAGWLGRYHRLMLDETIACLEAPELDLSQPLRLAGRDEPVTVGQILDHVILHGAAHVGELQVVRGLLGVASAGDEG